MSRARNEKRPTERKTGGKNRWRKMAWMPAAKGIMRRLKSGTVYEVMENGWHRVEPLRKEKHVYGTRWPMPKAIQKAISLAMAHAA